MVRSRASIISHFDDNFIDQKLFTYSETCSFNNEDIRLLKSNEVFNVDMIFRPFDASIQQDVVSSSWICFHKYQFSLGLKYPFIGIISEFLEVTNISYIQAMPVIWRMSEVIIISVSC